MKHALAPLTLRPRLGFPRRNRRGLIEASSPPRSTSARSPCFPRRNRRGLIEAPASAVSIPASTRVFPGGIAGASLKRLGHRHGRDTLPRFPRRNRRGLIEACDPTTANCPRAPVFPGGIAGASLKRHRASGMRIARVVFPGGIAGASLKHPAGPRPDADVARFPRRNRRGLIEAAPSRPARRRRARFSPAESPGPH